MLCSLMSSTNLPRPRSKRASSLRGRPWPTHFPFSAAVLTANLLPLAQGRLQTVDQLLHILFAQRLEQSSGDGSEAAKNLRFALPDDFGARARGCQVEARYERYVAAGHASLPFVLRALRAVCLGHFHFHVGGAFDVGNYYIHFHGEMSFVLYGHALKVREQRAELFGIGQKIVDLFGLARHFELSAKLNRHAPGSSCVRQPSRWL